ncbi:hypothetical protein ACP70R_033063 [Stipagrostis hirtigluma subsp. patula]
MSPRSLVFRSTMAEEPMVFAGREDVENLLDKARTRWTSSLQGKE